MRVLPDRGLGCQKPAQCFAISLRTVLPISSDRIPAVAQPLQVGVAILRNDSGDSLRVFHGKSKSDRSTVVEYVERVSIKPYQFCEAVDCLSDSIERGS